MLSLLSPWRRFLVGALALGFAGVAAAQEAVPRPPADNQPADSERVVIAVGEEKLTAADVERILRALPPQHRAFYALQGRQLLPQYLIRMKVLSAEARKQHREQDPEVQQAIEIATESILAEAARKHLEQGIPLSEEQVRQAYEQRKEEFQEVRLRHLVIRTETSILAQAYSPTKPPLSSADAHKKLEELRQQFVDGANFAELAQAYSDDLATAGAGGDMGYLTRKQLLPPVADAAFSLPPGEVSDIIPTPYGLELVVVEDRRVRPLDEVREQLEVQLRQSQVEALIQKLAAQYGVTVDSQFFSGPPASPPPSSKP